MARARGPDRRDGRAGGLRVAVLFVGVCLASAATVAVLVTHDPKLLRLAVVGALWAFLLAALAVPRRRALPPTPPDPPSGREVELRRTYEIELEREVAARREYELQLEVFLRRELEQRMRQEVEALRDEVQRLRSEVLDRLDGELRMERIETTRLIGGSLRALQDEARRLGISRPLVTDDASSSAEPAFAPGEGAARAVLPAAAEPEPSEGWSLYESLQRPTSPGADAAAGGGAPVEAPGSFAGPPGPGGYEQFPGDYRQSEPGPAAYGGDEPPPPAPLSRRPSRLDYSSQPATGEPGGYGQAVPLPPDREPWPVDPATEPPPAYTGYEPARWGPGDPFGRSPPGYEGVPPPRREEPAPGSGDPFGRSPPGYEGVPPPRREEPAPGPGDPFGRGPGGYEGAPPPAYTGYEPASGPGDPFGGGLGGYDAVPPARREGPAGWRRDWYESAPPPGSEPASRPGEPAAAWPGPPGPEPQPAGPNPGADPGLSLALPARGGIEFVAPLPPAYERSPAHRAPESGPGALASDPARRGRRPGRSAAPPGDAPAYSTDDELSRIFAGTMRPPGQPTGSEPETTERRRRHREDDEPNDVLSRLLGRS